MNDKNGKIRIATAIGIASLFLIAAGIMVGVIQTRASKAQVMIIEKALCDDIEKVQTDVTRVEEQAIKRQDEILLEVKAIGVALSTQISKISDEQAIINKVIYQHVGGD